MAMPSSDPINSIEPFSADGALNVIIDTPRNSRNKFVYNFEHRLFKLGGSLTAGHVFPYDFGFIPHTEGGDEDSLDVLVLMDEPAFCGCWVECRLVGGYQAMQTEGDRSNRNDRYLAVEKHSLVYSHVNTMDDLEKTLVEQIEHFFVSYNEAKDRRFEVEKLLSPQEAEKLIRDSVIPGAPKQ